MITGFERDTRIMALSAPAPLSAHLLLLMHIPLQGLNQSV
jgi:hypothetical protein